MAVGSTGTGYDGEAMCGKAKIQKYLHSPLLLNILEVLANTVRHTPEIKDDY